MSTGLQVFLISPAQVIVYSLDDPNTGIGYIFNAELLNEIRNPEITGFTEISGYITSSFGVKPMVLGYENSKYELVYAPRGLGYVFRSDGKLAHHGRIAVALKSAPIKIPDIDRVNLSIKSDSLPEVNLPDPDNEDIKRYISMSQQGIEYNINSTYDELRKPKINLPSSVKLNSTPSLSLSTSLSPPASNYTVAVAPASTSTSTSTSTSIPASASTSTSVPTKLPPLTQTSVSQRYDVGNNGETSESPVRALKSPSPRISKPKPSTDAITISKSAVTDQEIEKLRTEVTELRSIVRSLTQRIYQLYPVEVPQQLRLENLSGPIVELEEIHKKMANNEIDRMVVEPLFQPYAGSHRGNVRLLTFFAKDSKVYHVRAIYDPKTNKMDKPK